MKTQLLFPRDPLEPKSVDPDFIEEIEVARLHGFDCFLYDHDGFVKGGPPKFSEKFSETVVLRGWMMSGKQYDQFYKAVAANGGKLINSPEQYATAHYFPEAYSMSKTLRDNSPRAWFSTGYDVPNDVFAKMVKGLQWDKPREFLGGGDLLLKDYVKSAKHIPELHILESSLTEEEFDARIQSFINERGPLFAKGIVLKQAVGLLRYPDGLTNEWRIFLMNGEILQMSLNVSDATTERAMPTIIPEIINVSKEIGSAFMTIDIAEKNDRTWFVLECGDGQVSGLTPKGNVLEFYAKIKETLG